MSINPGEIIGSDLSPNANILGTQIADNTILLRNLTDDTFRIVQTGTGTAGAITTTNSSAGTWTTKSVQVPVAHNLGYAPANLVYVDFSGGAGTNLVTIPSTLFGTNTPNSAAYFWISYYVVVDATNLYINTTLTVYGAAGGSVTALPFKYYLLQEKASIT